MREMSVGLKAFLESQESFKYGHLVKFERPSGPLPGGKTSTSKELYAYFTDASVDQYFDDGSVDHLGTPNGVQRYVANKVISIPNISEETEARANNYNMSLNGNGIGAYFQATVNVAVVDSNFFDITLPSSVDPLNAGFRVGDKVNITGVAVPGFYNIDSFRANNVLRVRKITTALTSQVGVSATLELASDEILSLLADKQSVTYNSYVNREVWIYRSYFNSEGVLQGTILIFKGVISRVDLEDDENRGITVSWGLTSHWGDFAQVRGRLTSDDSHRALDSNGVPNPQAALKTVYAYDKGFIHSDTSVNMLARYVVQTEKQDIKVKRGFLGIGSKVKVKKYLVPEDRHTELDFSLSSKNIPLLYGVGIVSGINVFADTLKNDSSTVYTIQALCEGPIGGIYDTYIEGESLICLNASDFTARSTQTTDNTVKLVCRGRADRGDVLGGTVSDTGSNVLFFDTIYDYAYGFNFNYIGDRNFYKSYIVPPESPADTTLQAGLTHGKTLTITDPIDMTMDVFVGFSDQKAASAIVGIAKDGNFKLQSDYWAGKDTAEYWGPSHRLLDTAYVTNRFKISEGEETIPSLDYIVRGKFIEGYNYDYSYKHDPSITGENPDAFIIGQTVTLYNSLNGNVLNSNVYIVDKWRFVDINGAAEWRFRFSTTPALGYNTYIPTIKNFYMSSDGGATRWTMCTFDHTSLSGTISKQLSANLVSATDSSGKVLFTFSADTDMAVGGLSGETSPVYCIQNTSNGQISNNIFADGLITGSSVSSSTVTSRYPSSVLTTAQAAITGNKLVSRNTIKLSNVITVPATIKLVRVSTDGRIVTQERRVVSQDPTTGIATIDGLWDSSFIPSVGDTFQILNGQDLRVSINPAIQLLDYFTSTTYGKGFDTDDDIDTVSFLQTAREECDKRSDITVKVAPSTIQVGDIYRYPSSGPLIWQGQVKEFNSTHVTFTNVIGKLTYQWNSWRSFETNQIIYNGNNCYLIVSPGVKGTEPVHTSGTVNGLLYVPNRALNKVSGAGPTTLTFNTTGNPIQGLVGGVITSGYSLYDSDGIVYWKLVGWDSQDQRFVTKYQTNFNIDTSQPQFDITNSILAHFGGILRYSAGKYSLSVEGLPGEADIIDGSIRDITDRDIVGRIKLSDEGIRSSFNSITTAYNEPSNKFQSRTINFFNSEYLKIDRNVPKKGNLTLPGISNYYNARLLAERFLIKSRFSTKINLTLLPKAIALVSGEVIQITYSRYKWDKKQFRIDTLTILENGLIDISASEYNPSFYEAKNIDKQPGTGIMSSGATNLHSSPTSVSASDIDGTNNTVNQIIISWNNTIGIANASTEIWRSDTNDINTAVLIQTLSVPVSSYIDTISATADVTRYYWLRHRVRVISGNKSKTEYSAFTAVTVGSAKAIANLTLQSNITALAGLIADVEAIADGKITSFYQATSPASANTGDIWFDTDDGNKQYRWNGSWVAVQDTAIGDALTAAGQAQDTADGKVTTFVGTSIPTPEGIGDLWYNPSTLTLRRWDGLLWVLVGTAGAPIGSDISGLPVEVYNTLTPTGMLEDWNLHPDLTAVQRAWYVDTPANITLSTDGNMSGGKALYITGQIALRGNHKIPYSYEDLWRVKARAYVGAVGSGGNTHYVGITAFNALGVELGPTDYGSYHYFGGAHTPVAEGFYEWEGYFRGRAAVGTGAGVGGYPTTPSSPFPVMNGAVMIAPIFLANYTGTGGQISLDYISIDKVDDLVPLPTRAWLVGDFQKRGQVVTYLGRSWIALVDNTGVTPPSTSTGNSTWGLLADKGDTGTPGATGASAYTLIAYDNVNLTPSSITKTGGGFTWATGSAYTQQSFVNGAYVSFRTTFSDVFVGLNTDPLGVRDFPRIDYAIYPAGDTTLNVYEGGAYHPLGVSWTPGDILSVIYDGTNVRYLQNGIVRRTVAAAAGLKLHGDFIIYSPGASIVDIAFGAAGSAGSNGTNGINGINTATVLLFQRTASSTPPAVPDNDIVYDFSTQGTSGSLDGWSRALPTSGGSYRWFISATASNSTSSDTLTTGEWSSPALLSEDGGTGASGLNQAVVSLYKRGPTAPADPSGSFTYTFSTGVLSGGTLDGWTQAVPATDGNPLWVKQATAISVSATDSITAGEFSTAVKIVEDGTPGTPGTDSFIATSDIYAITIPCDAGGVPITGTLPVTITMQGVLGSVNVTGSTTWGSPIMTNCSVTNLGGGQYRVDSIGDNSGKFIVVATYSGRTQTITVTFAKALAGRAAVSVRDDTIIQATSASFIVASDILTLPFGPGQTLNLSVSGFYTISGAPSDGSQGRIIARAMYRNVTDGGAWTQAGADIVGNYAVADYFIFPDEPNHIPGDISGSVTGPAAPSSVKVFEIRLEIRRDGVAIDQTLVFTGSIT